MTTTFDIEEYFDSLPNNIEEITICYRGLTYLPDLRRFKKLKKLDCSNNNLTSLPRLPKKLKDLNCSKNELTCLHTLPVNLNYLNCEKNKLTSLPELHNRLVKLYCSNNKLNSLPALPSHLYHLDCSRNKIYRFPSIPQELSYFNYCYTPLFNIINSDTRGNIHIVRKKINIINNWQKIYRTNSQTKYYALKFKKQFRDWLWLRVRQPKIQKYYDAEYLSNLKEEDDLDSFLEDWVNKGPKFAI